MTFSVLLIILSVSDGFARSRKADLTAYIEFAAMSAVETVVHRKLETVGQFKSAIATLKFIDQAGRFADPTEKAEKFSEAIRLRAERDGWDPEVLMALRFCRTMLEHFYAANTKEKFRNERRAVFEAFINGIDAGSDLGQFPDMLLGKSFWSLRR